MNLIQHKETGERFNLERHILNNNTYLSAINDCTRMYGRI